VAFPGTGTRRQINFVLFFFREFFIAGAGRGGIIASGIIFKAEENNIIYGADRFIPDRRRILYFQCVPIPCLSPIQYPILSYSRKFPVVYMIPVHCHFSFISLTAE
jgi:hypothetical protein